MGEQCDLHNCITKKYQTQNVTAKNIKEAEFKMFGFASVITKLFCYKEEIKMSYSRNAISITQKDNEELKSHNGFTDQIESIAHAIANSTTAVHMTGLLAAKQAKQQKK